MPKLKQQTETDNLIKLYDFIVARNGANIQEIANFLGFKTQNCYRYLNILIERKDIFKGVAREPGVTKDDVETVTYFPEP